MDINVPILARSNPPVYTSSIQNQIKKAPNFQQGFRNPFPKELDQSSSLPGNHYLLGNQNNRNNNTTELQMDQVSKMLKPPFHSFPKSMNPDGQINQGYQDIMLKYQSK